MADIAKTSINFMLGAHLDLFWMGTPRDCLDRGCDIINKAMELCDQYDEYCYYIESTVFAEYYLSKYPEKREKLLWLIKEGKFEIACSYADRYEHMYGGESIVRHHILASRWLKNELGVIPESTCHSDLPGLSPQIPQICAEAEIDYYIRARGPCGVYNWVAPDGTSIIYCSVGYTYGKVSDKRLQAAIKDISDLAGNKGSGAQPLYVMRGGYGDLQMVDEDIVADAKRFTQIYENVDFNISIPSLVLRKYKNDSKLMKMLPDLSGEWPVGWGSVASGFPAAFQKDLYLENRILTAEKLTAIAELYGGKLETKMKDARWWIALGRFKGDIETPLIVVGNELEELWKAELFGQDHNYAGFNGPASDNNRAIIKQYCESYAEEIIDSGMKNISSQVKFPDNMKNEDFLGRIIIFNPLAWERDSIVCLDTYENKDFVPDGFDILDSYGKPVKQQIEEGKISFLAKGLPSIGYKSYFAVKKICRCKGSPTWFNSIRMGGRYILETERFRVEIDIQSGTVAVLYDKKLDKNLAGGTSAGRFGEVIAYEESNVDVIYAFTGVMERDSRCVKDVYEKAAGPLSVTIAIESSLFDSRIVKEFTFHQDIPVIDVKLTVFWWGKRNQQLRLCLPFAQEGFKSTRYGVPYYNMEWPKMMDGVDDDVVLGVGTINSDEIDADSRLHIRDVCKWLDVGYDGYGVALGVKNTPVYIDGTRIEPMMLRSKVSCGDPHVWVLNQGEHVFEYAIYPHIGDWKHAGVYKFGWENVNAPVVKLYGSVPENMGMLQVDSMSFFSADHDNIIVSAVKPAYDDPDAVVVRFFEVHGKAVDVSLHCPKQVAEAYSSNLLEAKKDLLAYKGNCITVPTRPYQIKTIVVKMK